MPLITDSHETWDPNVTYVIGHQRPDTDAIASALGYAWFLTNTGSENVVASRAGQPNGQVAFALQRFEQAAPRLLAAVAPTFAHVLRTQVALTPDQPISQAMARLAQGEPTVPVVDADGKPTGAVTPLALARVYSLAIGHLDAMAPSYHSLVEELPIFRARDRISDHRNALLRSDSNEFLVVDDAGRYVGMATQRRLLQPPRARLILVDHNELSQAVNGADEADIVAVLDHHRLGNPPTAAPIPFVVDPIGSTATLVAEQCRAHDLTPPTGIAGMLLSGILSDTLVFRSPTVTDRDRAAAAWLAEIAKVDADTYGEELLRAAPGLNNRAAEDIANADRKNYDMGEVAVSIAQVEVTGLQELPQRREELLETMDQIALRENLALMCLMVTDVVTGRSHMLCRGSSQLLDGLPFARSDEFEFDLGDIVSRKKQLVPIINSALEDGL